MSLADLANLGELIAGVGVIVSLLYLAGQIRESRRLATWNAHLVISGSISEITADVAKDPELFRVWRGRQEGSSSNAESPPRLRVGDGNNEPLPSPLGRAYAEVGGVRSDGRML